MVSRWLYVRAACWRCLLHCRVLSAVLSQIVCGVRSSADDVTRVSSIGMIIADVLSADLPAENLNLSSVWMSLAMVAACVCCVALL